MSDDKNIPPNKPTSAPVSLRSSTLQSLIRATPAQAGSPANLLSRPSVNATPKARAARAATFSFTPNISRPSVSTQPVVKSAGTPTPAQGMSVQNMLAHRLAVQTPSAGTSSLRSTNYQPVSRIVSTSLQNKMAQYDQMRRRRADGKKSREILELSWSANGDDASTYRPISLPYVLRDGDEGAEDKQSQRPSIKKVDDANCNATALFDDENEDDDYDVNKWIMIQLPSRLPALDKIAMDKQREEEELSLLTEEEAQAKKLQMEQKEARKRQMGNTFEHVDDRYQPSRIAGLPEGKLGKIVIRKSGKVELLIGDHTFDINQGSNCNFAQEIGAYLPGNSEFFFLGRCLKKMIVTPNVEKLVTAATSES